MSIIGSIGGLQSALYAKMPGADAAGKIGATQIEKPLKTGELGGVGEVPSSSFGQVMEGLVNSVASKQAEASSLTKDVLMGNSDKLHQSVIAMQEASVAFSMMIEVRNKLVDSYQELMRMPV